jgi:hypothetical protein
MSSTPTRPAGASGVPWWLAPTAVGVVAVGGALAWVYVQWQADSPAPVPPATTGPGPTSPLRPLPGPPKGGEPGRVHWVGHGVEHGVNVVDVQAVPGGDILVVDAATGRLIETRPAKPK